MQANSQHPGQLQTFRANGDPSGDWTSNNMDHNYYQKGLPPHSANLSNPGQTNTGNYMAQFSCTVLQPTSNQTVTGSTQSTSEMQPAQKNPLNSGTLPSGNQNPNIVLWTVPGSSVQIYVPVSNMSLHETNVAFNNNGPSISHCVPRPGTEVLNYNNSACMQQQTTSVPAGPNNSQQFPTKLMNNKNPNDPQGNLSPFTHANATNILPQGPSSSRYYPTTTNAPIGQISSLGGPVYHRVRAEYSSDHANLQALSKLNVQKNNVTKKAVAVVTPLSPIEMASVNFSNKSAYALDAQPVHCQPNFTHPLEVNANLQTIGEPNDPTSKRPKSAEPRLESDVVKSPVCLLKSTSLQPNSAVTEQNKSAEIQKEASEVPKDNHTVTDKKTNTKETGKYSTIPVIEWPLDKLQTLIHIIHQVEDGQQKNINKMNAGKEILRLYWNGDFCKFRDTVKTGIYQNVMEEVYNYCQMEDEVILRQIKKDAKNQVAEDFHILKHNEVPPKMEYRSSWLNLNEKLDDIDRECGVSWYFRCLYSASLKRVEHEEGNSAGQLQRNLQTKHQCSTKTTWQNKVSENEQTAWKSTDKTLDSEQFLPVTDHNHSTNIEIDSSISKNVSAPKTFSVTPAAVHCVEEDLKEVNTAPQEMMLSYSNPPQELQRALPDVVCKLPITGHDRCVTEIASKTPEVQTSSELKQNSLDSRSVHKNSSDARKRNESMTSNSMASLNLKQKRVLSSQIPNESQVQNSASTTQSSLLDETGKSQSLSVVAGQNNCQPNTVDAVKGIGNMLRTLEKCDTSLGIYENQIGKNKVLKRTIQHSTRASAMPKLHNRLSNGSAGRCPILTEMLIQRDSTSLPKLSPAIAKQQVQIQNNCAMKIVNKEPETSENLKRSENLSGLGNEQSSTETDNNRSMKRKYMDTDQSSNQPSIVNPLLAMAGIVCTLDKSIASKSGVLERKRHSTEMSRRDVTSVLTKPNIQSACTNSSNLIPSSQEQQEAVPSPQMQNDCNDKMPNSAETDAINVSPHKVAKLCFASEVTEGEDVQRDTAGPPKIVHVSTLLNSEQCFITDKQCDPLPPRSFHDSPELLQKENMGSFKEPNNSVLAAQNTSLRYLDKPSEEDLLKRMHHSAVTKSRLDVGGCDGTQAISPDVATSENDLSPPKLDPVKFVSSAQMQNESNERLPNDDLSPPKLAPVKLVPSPQMQNESNETLPNDDLSPPKLDPVKFVSSAQMQNESNETLPNDDLSPPKLDPVELVPSPQMQTESNEMLPNDDFICETVTEPNTVALHVNPEEFAMDDLASIKIDVLPHEIAEQWFADKMTEDKDWQTVIDVCTSCVDQVDNKVHDQVEVSLLEHSDDEMEIEILNHSDDQIKVLFSEKHGEDIKPLERTNPGAVDVKLEFYCCLAKWVQILKHADDSLCMCQLKTELSEEKIKIEADEMSVKIQTKDCVDFISKDHGCKELKTDPLTTDEYSSECTKTSTLNTDKSHDDDADDDIKTCPDLKEVFKDEEATSEQVKDESPSKCAGDEILKQSEKDNPSPDVKKRSETVCFSLFGSSNKRDGLIRSKRYKDGGIAPPEILKVTISSDQKNDRRMSKKRKWDESMENNDDLNVKRKDTRVSPNSCDKSKTPQVPKTTPMKVSEVTYENAIFSTTSTRKLFNPPHHSKSSSKKRRSLGTRQISMNSFIIKRRTVSPKSLHLPERVLKSKYELGNPALMPLQEGFGLEFKVLPSSFNFEDKTELQADTSPNAKNEISYTEDKKAKRRKTSHAPTQGTWSFSPFKAKPIESTNVSSSGSLFQEFKKRYQERKEIVSRPNLNSN